jgi:fructose-specific component phosphotransferase system IIB-like protein
MNGEQKRFAETQAINEAAFAWLEKADEADIVLIAGDLSFNGKKKSNEVFSKLLHDFKEKSGKRIYIVTASHDFNDTPFCFSESGRGTVDVTKFSELLGYYGDFGYRDAIAFNEEHLS